MAPSGARPPRHALVSVAVLPLRSSPDHRSEQVTDAALGTPLEVLEPGGEWWRVRHPDRTVGFVRSLGILACTKARARLFAASPRLADVSTELRLAPRSGAFLNLPAGARLLAKRPSGGWNRVELPDGSPAVHRGRCARPAAARGGAALVGAAMAYLGVPYIWGGTTGWGLDCSGLVRLACDLCGKNPGRDARDQFRVGRAVGSPRAEPLAPGDLLFFGETPGDISHVSIHIGAGRYIHSCGSVRLNSMRPQDPDYLPSFAAQFRGARRLFF